MRSWSCQKEACLLCLGRIVGKPYLGITSGLSIPKTLRRLHSREELAENGSWEAGLFHKVLQLSCELEHLIRCLRAVPASTNFAKSGGHVRAKEARHDESWKYIEENCTVGNDAAAVCAKHGERLAHRIREHSHVFPGTSQSVGIAAVLENEHRQRGDHGSVCDKPVGHVRNRLSLEAGAVEDADQPGQPFGDRTICFSKWGALSPRSHRPD